MKDLFILYMFFIIADIKIEKFKLVITSDSVRVISDQSMTQSSTLIGHQWLRQSVSVWHSVSHWRYQH